MQSIQLKLRSKIVLQDKEKEKPKDIDYDKESYDEMLRIQEIGRNWEQYEHDRFNDRNK